MRFKLESREMFRPVWLLLLLLLSLLARTGAEVEGEQQVGHKLRHHPRHKSRRQAAADEAIRELRILESQDGQLRAFADSTTQSQRARQRHQHQLEHQAEPNWWPPPPARDFRCHLTLMTNEHWNKTPASRPLEREQIEPVNEMEGDNFCLRFPQLAAQIPPFMLSLYRQLAFDIGVGGVGGHEGRDEQPQRRQQQQHLNFSETVQMMPYRAEIMRSFRQPKLAGRAQGAIGSGGRLRGDYDDELDALAASAAAIWRPGEQAGEPAEGGRGGPPQDKAASNGWPQQGAADGTRRRRGRGTTRGRRRRHQRRRHSDRVPIGEPTGNIMVELSVSNGADEPSPGPEASSRWRHHSQAPLASPACDLRQRLLPADQRDEICFWFRLDQELNQLVGSSDEQRRLGAGGPAERLIEAELHVFKLFPRLSRRSIGQLDGQTPFRMAKQQFAHTNHTMSAANLYHLRTNLLEVSLYQILPKRSAGSEFPLRLLDIRRIDLNSNGWETFYVKRAVEDWLKEPRSNLGFVIKAKSMFDEPIQVGLIRFADAYDEPEPADEVELRSRKREAGKTPVEQLEPLQARSNFSLSHQPLLVIYTTRNS